MALAATPAGFLSSAAIEAGSRNISGWIKQEPDIRDFYFSAAPAQLAALPPAIDLSGVIAIAPWVPPFDQLALGSCGPNTGSGDITDAALRLQGLPACPMPSRLFTYYNTRVIMGPQYVNQDSGVDNRSMMKALAQYGWCDETLWPYDIAKFRVKPPANCYTQAATRKIVAYHAVPRDLAQMKACLAGNPASGTKGDPFLFGFSVFPGLVSAATAASGIVPDPAPNEQPIGGHDILFVGYDDAKQMFKFRNSWGPGWGQGGYGWISYKYATSQLADDFWTVTHSAIPDPVTPPDPPVPPIPPIPPVGGQVNVQSPAGLVWSINGKVVTA